MKRFLATVIFLNLLHWTSAQVLQGKATLAGQAVAVSGHNATLTWNVVANAASYNLYRGAVSGGPYVLIASGIAGTTYTDTSVGQNQTVYYVATSVVGQKESGFSNETIAVIP